MTIFEAWQSPDETEIALSTPENHAQCRASGLGPNEDWTLLHTVEADDFEAAMREHAALMGWKPVE